MKKQKSSYLTPRVAVVRFMVEQGFEGTLSVDKTENDMMGVQDYENTDWNSPSGDDQGYF